MTMLLLLLSLWSTPVPPAGPPSWRVALSRGPLPSLKDGRVITSADSYIKWIVADRCVIQLGPETAIIISAGVLSAGVLSACPRLHLIAGTLRIAAPADNPVELTWDGGRRTVIGLLTVSRHGNRIRFDGPAPVEPGVGYGKSPSVRPVWQLQTRIRQLLRESFSRSNETLVQASAGSSMCLDSGGSTGDVGNNQTGITQLPPSSKLHIHVPYPRQVDR